jgi:hypothetical protein
MSDIDKILSCEDIFNCDDIRELREIAKKYYVANLTNTTVENPYVGVIKFNKVGRREFFHYGANKNKIIIVPYLRGIIKTAKLVEFRDLEHPRKDKMKGFYYFASKILLNNEITTIEIVVSLDEHKNRLFYDIFFETIEKRSENKKTHKTDS